MKLSRVSLAIAFALGSAAWPVIATFVARPAHALPASVQKWTQFCTPYAEKDKFVEPANAAGNINPVLKSRGLEGWELISVVPFPASGYTGGLLYCLRQPMP